MLEMSRPLNTAIWGDPVVGEDMTPEDKYFYLYLLTSPATSEIGIYPLTKKRIAFELGYPLEKIETLVERFIHRFDLIRYNEETREIAIKNWGTHNFQHTENIPINRVKLELSRVKDLSLIPFVAEGIEHKTMQTLFLKKFHERAEENHSETKAADKNRWRPEIST